MISRRPTSRLLVNSLAAIAIAFGAGTATAEDEKELDVALTDLPAAVRATAEQNADSGTLTEAELEEENGQKIYSVEVKKADGSELEIEIALDGKLIKVEKEDDEGDDDDDEKEQDVALADLPAAVKATAEQNSDGGTLTEAELEEENGQKIYSVEVKKADGSELEIEIAADGKLLKVEKEDDDDDDGDDDEKEQKIEASAAPAGVQEAIGKFLKDGAAMKAVIQEREHGKTVYEVEYKVENVEHSLKLSANGDVIERENEITTGSLPADVSAALKKKFPNAEIKEAEEVTLHFYELEIKTAGGKNREVKISPAGKIMGSEEDDDDEDDD